MKCNDESLNLSISNFKSSNKCILLITLLLVLAGFLWKNVLDLTEWKKEFQSVIGITKSRDNKEIIVVSHTESNCGIPYTCPKDSFPLYLSTGNAVELPPQLCISGKHLISRDLIGLRGLNAVIVDPHRFDIVAQRNFDTYLTDKSNEINSWLSSALDNDIIIIFTSDEASLKLTTDSRSLLNELGSGLIQNLRFRSQWYMITQKGTQGYTIYEKMTFSRNKSWAEMIEFRHCIPRIVPKQRTVADNTLHENKLRSHFCEGKKDEQYRGFCQESRFELIIPALLTNRSLIGNPAFSSPLYLFASDDFQILTASLESLIHQAGIYLPLVTILYEEHQKDIPDMAALYGVHAQKLSFQRSYVKKLNQARQLSLKKYPKQPFIIVIDKNVILSPDFLFFMAQTIQVLEKDHTVSAISAWSPNCYSHEGDVHLAFRAEGFPKYGALIPLKSRTDAFGEMITPDVSRVQGPVACHPPSLEADNWIMRPQDLSKERYFYKLVMLQKLGEVVELQYFMSNCSNTMISKKISVIYFIYDEEILSDITKCLGVQRGEFGMYEGIIQVTVSSKIVLLISSESSFYRSRPIVTA